MDELVRSIDAMSRSVGMHLDYGLCVDAPASAPPPSLHLPPLLVLDRAERGMRGG